ncbi:AMP-dependent synthetase/ligase [Pseudonocardia thermophila]|uniref:AMP-dependent synthetase/ligase n=1 Tax=Pseudonocardia thermophila TaxID=1848 RepID=UPI000937FA75|nr:AMP-binding protein [Pseudonocardia thermophila]
MSSDTDLARAAVPWIGGPADGWTVASAFAARVERCPDAICLVRVDSDYRTTPLTWAQLHTRVQAWQAWLAARGVGFGDRVASLMSPDVDAIALELALYCLGAVSVSLYPTSADSQIADVIAAAGARLFVCDRAPGTAPRVPAELPVTVADRDDWPDLTQPVEPPEPPADITPDTIACIVFTSGTTGRPKGVVHTHGTLMHAAVTGRPRRYRGQAVPDRILWHLPMAHVVGKLRSTVMPLVMDLVNYVPAPGLDHWRLLQLVRPTYVVEPPRFWAKAKERVAERITLPDVIRAPLDRNAQHCVERLWAGGCPGWIRRALWELTCKVVYRPALDRVGYRELRQPYISSAPIPIELVRQWHMWGVDLRVTYGLTESAGRVTEQTRPFSDARTIGTCVDEPGWQVRIAEDGELLVRGPSMFTGYWENPEETAAAIVDGWFRTGDLAQAAPDGTISLVGRKKDVLITEGGKTVSPQSIEVHFPSVPGVERIVVVGDGRKYLTALVEASPGAAVDDELRERVRRGIEAVNAKVSRPEQIKDFRFLNEPLSVGAGYMTGNGKLRRAKIEEGFAALIDEMYR